MKKGVVIILSLCLFTLACKSKKLVENEETVNAKPDTTEEPVGLEMDKETLQGMKDGMMNELKSRLALTPEQEAKFNQIEDQFNFDVENAKELSKQEGGESYTKLIAELKKNKLMAFKSFFTQEQYMIYQEYQEEVKSLLPGLD